MWEEEVSANNKLNLNTIRLMTPGEASHLVEAKVKVKNAFHVDYVYECIKASAILMNLSHFKVTG